MSGTFCGPAGLFVRIKIWPQLELDFCPDYAPGLRKKSEKITISYHKLLLLLIIIYGVLDMSVVELDIHPPLKSSD
ncbi:hypothetical protein NEOLEDRAFT_892122 [Neolentinus lepideus HHB14362 ss-1]|uniref:Uncharacterized protein n=1 Tax=Neolentinus lepideus HHB14362 ss-1 TaxID=1314782 RepID=A0A165NTP6_9AGAM|nr:hypothetical protein NEOLEDRAFT_892122 [Neolentinus lepideus HHB14362 ss-1]